MTVEFLPSDDAPEQLSGPPAAPRRRWWWLLGAVVAVAALGYTLTRPSTSHPSTQLTYRAVAACRGVPDCAVRHRVPPQIIRLARADLPPGARVTVRSVVSVHSITHEELLVARTITASTDWVTIRIFINRSGDRDRPLAVGPFGFRSVSLQHVNSGFTVRLDYLAPESLPPRLDRLKALIRDPRIASS